MGWRYRNRRCQGSRYGCDMDNVKSGESCDMALAVSRASRLNFQIIRRNRQGLRNIPYRLHYVCKTFTRSRCFTNCMTQCAGEAMVACWVVSWGFLLLLLCLFQFSIQQYCHELRDLLRAYLFFCMLKHMGRTTAPAGLLII